MYNLTNITAASNIVQSMTAVNQLSNNVFAYLILFSVFFVIFVSLINYNKIDVLLADGFITALLASLMYILQWVPWWTILLPILIMAFAIVTKFMMKD